MCRLRFANSSIMRSKICESDVRGASDMYAHLSIYNRLASRDTLIRPQSAIASE